MTTALIRPFRRADRDQLTQLVQAHAMAVVPGMRASASTVLAALDRRPGELIEDPWVGERMTLVAEQQHRVVAAAHLLRYFGDERAGPGRRGAGVIEWLVFWPHAPADNPAWPDGVPAARALMAGCLGQLQRWEVSRQDAGGELPVPGVYGVPAQWPHVAALYEQAGFAHTGHTEIVYLARTRDLARPAGPPLPGMSVRRSVGMNGCRLSAVRAAEVLGYIEVETFDQGERQARYGGWADIGNLCVAAPHCRRGIGTWLLGQAADWLELAGVDRVLDYAWLDGTDPGGVDYAAWRAFLPARGFRELTRTRRGWTRTP
ncbi:MAG TPA: GNAT family N-acetyltransferase [Streptosporangiaceae bacterium]|jgi:ribosomal protein S18 acetylase RimI-like enzyme